MRALTIDKRDWSQRTYDLPPGCLFHVANAWEERDGTIRLHYMRSDNPMSLLAGWSVMRGEYLHQEGARVTSLVLDPNGRSSQSTLGECESEFPVVAADDVGRPYSRMLCIERSESRPMDVPGFDQVALLDVDSGASQRFSYGDDWSVEEHLFLMPAGAARPRWIAGTALDTRAGNTVLSIFEAEHLSDGPIAQARLPYSIPLGLHGTFLAQDGIA